MIEQMPNGAGENPELYDVPRDLADESESELANKDLDDELEKVIVHFTEGDLQDLMNGEDMNWVFHLKDGRMIDLFLTTSDEYGEQ